MTKATEKAVTTATIKDSKKDTKPASKKPKLNLKKLSLEREPLKSAGENREACAFCKRFAKCDAAYRMPDVPEAWSGKLLIVTAGDEEGKALKLLRRMWRRAGWADSDVATVGAVRCESNRAPSMAQIRACRPFLLQVIEKLKPKNIIGMGAVAMRALRNDG